MKPILVYIGVHFTKTNGRTFYHRTWSEIWTDLDGHHIHPVMYVAFGYKRKDTDSETNKDKHVLLEMLSFWLLFVDTSVYNADAIRGQRYHTKQGDMGV